MALLARQHLDFGAEGACAEEVVPGRMVAACLRSAALGRVVVYAAYLHPAEGLSDANFGVVGSLMAHAAQHQLPWIALGDWSLRPNILAHFLDTAAAAARAPTARVIATTAPHLRG